jgi:transcription-repair coupling factor (superfamily II helicase)
MAVAAFRNRARQHGITEVSVQGNAVRFAPLELRESQQLRLQRVYKGAIVKQAVRTVLVPKPDVRDTDLLAWCTDVLDAVLDQPVAAAAEGSTT